MKQGLPAFGLTLLALASNALAALPTPVDVWRDYDPDRGEFKEQVVREGVTAGVTRLRGLGGY